MKSIVVIQARLNSSRLPAKVLLPINGIPLVVLAANRAANTGKDVLVATSNERSDNAICDELKRNKIRYFRGSLNNTLDRFVTSLESYADDTIVFRLTADNVVPDGHLLDELEYFFLKNKLNYLVCNGEHSGLPYGVSAEVMMLSGLREALNSTSAPFDLEHVTPFIHRKFGKTYFDKYINLSMGNYRCTIDTFDDYLNTQHLFSDIYFPEKISWLQLVKNLKTQSKHILLEQPAHKLVLGSAQIGLHYGINNQSGKPDFTVAEELVKKAICNGIKYIDTAHAYGDSEQVIGEILSGGWESRATLITKLSPFNHDHKKIDDLSLGEFVKSSVYKSCFDLRVKKLACLMLHKAEHLLKDNKVIWNTLLELQKQDVIDNLGVSVQTPAELELALNNEKITFIQMPYNILDHRWLETIKLIENTKKQRKLIIHTRSSLLQGLLLSKDYNLWEKANINNPATIINHLTDLVKKTKCESIIELCIRYMRSLNWIDGIVIGMETITQLEENLQLFSKVEFSEQTVKLIDKSKLGLSENTLNPANWKV